MAKQGGKKFTWVLKIIDSYNNSNTLVSDAFEIGNSWTCRLSAAPYANNPELLCVHLVIANVQSVPTEGRRCVKFRLTVVNQLSEELSVTEEGLHWFDSFAMQWCSATVFFLPKLRDKDGGFLVNDEIKIYAEAEVLQVLGKLATLENLEKTEEDSCVLLKETSTIYESLMGVNGFHVLPSQVEPVTRLFERHPDIVVGFRAKNQLLRNSCMNSLLSLIETLCQPTQDLFNEDLVEAEIALTYVKNSGFSVEWLEKKLEQVKEKKKKKEESGLAVLQEIEKNLLKLTQQCAELGVLADKQKAELLALKTPLSFDDVV